MLKEIKRFVGIGVFGMGVACAGLALGSMAPTTSATALKGVCIGATAGVPSVQAQSSATSDGGAPGRGGSDVQWTAGVSVRTAPAHSGGTSTANQGSNTQGSTGPTGSTAPQSQGSSGSQGTADAGSLINANAPVSLANTGTTTGGTSGSGSLVNANAPVAGLNGATTVGGTAGAASAC